MKYLIHIKDSADYEIETDDVEKAKQIAWEWFIEREPTFEVSVADKEKE